MRSIVRVFLMIAPMVYFWRRKNLNFFCNYVSRHTGSLYFVYVLTTHLRIGDLDRPCRGVFILQSFVREGFLFLFSFLLNNSYCFCVVIRHFCSFIFMPVLCVKILWWVGCRALGYLQIKNCHSSCRLIPLRSWDAIFYRWKVRWGRGRVEVLEVVVNYEMNISTRLAVSISLFLIMWSVGSISFLHFG